MKLTSELLQVRKLLLLKHVRGGGTVFPVLKSDGVHQREVWHGTRLPQASAAPPRPPLFAGPESLLQLEGLHGTRAYLSKRDASCYFDQLQLPVHLLFDRFQLFLRATGLKHHQTSLFQGRHIHVDGFDNLQVFTQALHQSAATSFSQNCCGQIGTRDGLLIRCRRDGPDHQQTCRFQALEVATLAAALERK